MKTHVEDDDNNNSLPMGIEAIPNATEGRVEQIDDNVGPEPPAAVLEALLNAADPEIASKTSATLRNNLASVNEHSSHPPVPFKSAEFEDDKDTTAKKKKAKDEINQQKPAAVSTDIDRDVSMPSSVRDSIYEPSREVVEGSEGNTNKGRGDTNRRGWEDTGSNSTHNDARDIESQTRTDNNEDTACVYETLYAEPHK